jgi:hypothetical protein
MNDGHWSRAAELDWIAAVYWRTPKLCLHGCHIRVLGPSINRYEICEGVEKRMAYKVQLKTNIRTVVCQVGARLTQGIWRWSHTVHIYMYKTFKLPGGFRRTY